MIMFLLFSINVYLIYNLHSLTALVNELMNAVEHLEYLSDKE